MCGLVEFALGRPGLLGDLGARVLETHPAAGQGPYPAHQIVDLRDLPRSRCHTRGAWAVVALFGVALGVMNGSFYASLARLPIGVAGTIEFIGPLTLAAVLSRKVADLVAVAAAAVGIAMISEALTPPWAQLDFMGIGPAPLAGAFWAA